jgi:hypothetical protein
MPPPLAVAAQVADAAAGSASGSGAAKAPSSNDLLVVGPGVLGSYLGKLWLEQYPAATVVGQTNSDANHDRWLMLAHFQWHHACCFVVHVWLESRWGSSSLATRGSTIAADAMRTAL